MAPLSTKNDHEAIKDIDEHKIKDSETEDNTDQYKSSDTKESEDASERKKMSESGTEKDKEQKQEENGNGNALNISDQRNDGSASKPEMIKLGQRIRTLIDDGRLNLKRRHTSLDMQ
ncbi:MAG: hypothetical protein EZS28_055060, partial [Streblomastix strix]